MTGFIEGSSCQVRRQAGKEPLPVQHPVPEKKLRPHKRKTKPQLLDSGVLIAPVWPNQAWFLSLLKNLVGVSILLPQTQDIIERRERMPHAVIMEGHLPLAAWPASGNTIVQEMDFHRELLQCSTTHGKDQRRQPTPVLGGNGFAAALNGK